MSLLRFGHLCGELAAMFYLQNQTLPNGRCRLTLSAPFAASRMKQRNTFCGSAHLPITFGPWFGVSCKRAVQWPRTFSCLHVIWWRGLTERSSSCGLWRRGLCGTLVTASILNMFKPTRVRSLNKPTPCMKNIRDLPSPFPTDEISAYTYTLFF